MEQPATSQNLGEMLQFLSQQQAQLQANFNEQLAAQSARFETLLTKPRAARKAEPPQYQGTLHEDLELWFFTIEQYYSDYHPLMGENSPTFVTMISCHLAPTPMNWYRQFVLECERSDITRTWETFKCALRKRFLPPDNEYQLREKLCKLTQKGSLHDYIGEFQNILVQCQLQISALELRFYFQQGLRQETSSHIREHHPANLEQAIELALRFDHGLPGGRQATLGDDWEKSATCHRCRQVGHIAPKCPEQHQ